MLITGKLVGELTDGAIEGSVFGLETFDTTLALPKFGNSCIMFYTLTSK